MIRAAQRVHVCVVALRVHVLRRAAVFLFRRHVSLQRRSGYKGSVDFWPRRRRSFHPFETASQRGATPCLSLLLMHQSHLCVCNQRHRLHRRNSNTRTSMVIVPPRNTSESRCNACAVYSARNIHIPIWKHHPGISTRLTTAIAPSHASVQY